MADDSFSIREREAARRALPYYLREDFGTFLPKVFYTVSPGQPYLPNWHLDALAHVLMRVARGELKRLIILMPPRNLKSIAASVAFPAWMLGRDPTQRLICVSYSADLAAKHARDCRAVMSSPWYAAAFPGTRLDASKNSETEFMTTRRGFRLATSTGGTLTGRGGNILVIDDPLKPADAQSEPRRKDCQHWYGNTLLSRLDDKREGAIILVMQRLHVDDLAGYLLQQGGWEVLELPAIAEREQLIATAPGQHYRRTAGGVLHPAREPLAVLERLKVEMGSYDFSAQYQQAPVPPEGNMIRWEWFKFFTERPPAQTGSALIQSWDTASTTSEMADYSVGITAQVETNGDVSILDIVRGRWAFPDLLREMERLHACHRPRLVLIEDHASGTALQQTLKIRGLPVKPVKPQGDKAMRMLAHTATIEGGKVRLKNGASWIEDFRMEVLAFPHGHHDDQVDALSQLLTWVLERHRRTGGSLEMIW